MAAQTEQIVGGGPKGIFAGTLMGGVALGAVGMLVLGAAVPRAGAVLAAAPAVEATAPAADVQFAAHAIGTVERSTPLQERPGGEQGLATVPAGTALRIGGKVRVPAGLGTRDVLWVSVADDSGQRFGFVNAADVVVSAGDAPLLQLGAIPPEALLAPGMAVRHGSGADTTAGTTATTGGAPVAMAAAAAPASNGTVDLAWLPDTVTRWSDLLVAAGAKYHIDPDLLAILVLVESGGNPKVVSPSGAVGLMQIMPATAAGIARQQGIADHSTARLYDAAYNIDFGAFYIAEQLKAFGQADDADWQKSVELAASAYNGGPGAAQRYARGGALPAETQRYQRWVGGMWRERHDATSATLDAWMAAGGRVLVQRAGVS
jgi:hypothetical protein